MCLSVSVEGGSCEKGILCERGLCERGWGGGLSTDMAGTEAGSTHPTGIHSCLSSLSCLNISFDVQMRKWPYFVCLPITTFIFSSFFQSPCGCGGNTCRLYINNAVASDTGMNTHINSYHTGCGVTVACMCTTIRFILTGNGALHEHVYLLCSVYSMLLLLGKIYLPMCVIYLHGSQHYQYLAMKGLAWCISSRQPITPKADKLEIRSHQFD